MAGWYCSRCEQTVVMGSYPPCGCKESPSPWWYVPTTWIETMQCFLGLCKYESVCANCSPHFPDPEDVIKS